MIKLYYSPGACSLAPHIALAEAGIEHEMQKLDLRAGEQKSPDYLALNPKGAVPALQTDRGVLTENPAILQWLAAEHPDARLAPAGDAFELARFNGFTGFLSASVHPAMGRWLFGKPALEGEARDKAREFALSKLRVVEDSLFQGPYAFGDRFTAADGYLYVFERWTKQAGELDAFPKLADHLRRMQERPGVLEALRMEGLQPL